MEKTTCANCDKQIENRDSFRLDFSDIVNPLTGDIEIVGQDLCLSCYRHKAACLHMQKVKMLH